MFVRIDNNNNVVDIDHRGRYGDYILVNNPDVFDEQFNPIKDDVYVYYIDPNTMENLDHEDYEKYDPRLRKEYHHIDDYEKYHRRKKYHSELPNMKVTVKKRSDQEIKNHPDYVDQKKLRAKTNIAEAFETSKELSLNRKAMDTLINTIMHSLTMSSLKRKLKTLTRDPNSNLSKWITYNNKIKNIINMD